MRCKEYSRALRGKDVSPCETLGFTCMYYSIQNAVLQQYKDKKTAPESVFAFKRGYFSVLHL